MLVILLHAAAVAAMHSDVVDGGNEVKDFLYIAHSSQNTDDGRLTNSKDILKREIGQFYKDVGGLARKKRQVLKSFTYPNSTWKDGIPYTFNTSDELVQNVFKKGVKVWTENTCIDFVENRTAQDKLVVVKTDACSSFVGQRGGDQLLCLGGAFLRERAAIHEIGHVLGLLHTMQRYDRDNFIRIVVQNINPRYYIAFAKADNVMVDVHGLSYDYGSIMHYAEKTLSSNNQTTLIAIDPRYQKTMGSELISFSDLFMVNEHHGCNTICNKSTSAKCENEGFPHPRNCSICICPGGYGGDLCDRRPPGCGENLDATRRKKSVTYTLDVERVLQDHFYFCNYMIMAPEGMKIEMNLQAISRGYDLPGCPKGGVEVKAQVDQKLTGYRFCSMNGTGGPILSNSNRLPVVIYNRFGSMEIKFTYRSVR